jgi:hypothetical protein
LHGCIDFANTGLEGSEVLVLNAEETMQFLLRKGVEFLAEHGTFFTLITSYLLHVNNLHSLLESDINFGILDPGGIV